MKRLPLGLLLIASLLSAPSAHGAEPGRVLRVGPGRTLTTPSAAAAVAVNGDTVEIDAGTYLGDVATWTQNNLTLRGVGGRAVLDADGANAQGKGIWVIAGNNTRVENIEFTGATVPDGNGAGIRQEGAGLVITGCSFHDNENGILAGANPTSDIEIRRSKFARNGAGDGFTHNIYIGAVRSFYLKGSYIMAAKVGHEVKSRALKNTITANLIVDRSGTASYSIDLPNGGDTKIAGNVIEQGPNSENSGIISYGAEGLTNPTTRLWLVNNTIVNHRDSGTFVVLAPGAGDVHLWNNLLVGPGDLVSGTAQREANLRVGTSGFVDAAGFDFRLKADSRAINKASWAPEQKRPRYEYRHPQRYVERVRDGARYDLGAFEFRG